MSKKKDSSRGWPAPPEHRHEGNSIDHMFGEVIKHETRKDRHINCAGNACRIYEPVHVTFENGKKGAE